MRYSLRNVDTRPHSSFVGIHQELCFSANWLNYGSNGYVSINAKELERTVPAHRMVMMLLVGQVDGNVLHRCGNSNCYNPYHLYIGSPRENTRDKTLHSRSEPLWGNLHQTYPCGNHIAVEMKQPLVLSTETCQRSLKFKGFTPCTCFHVDWLARTNDGYLQLHGIQNDGIITGAHRKIYMLFRGPIEKESIIGHRCGDPTCLNPYHLVITGRMDSREYNQKYDRRFILKSKDKRYKKNRT